MAISGDVARPSAEQMAILIRAREFYESAAGIIKSGVSRRYGEIGPSYRYPRGWQALRRLSADGSSALCVVHAFADPPSAGARVPLPPGSWKIADDFYGPPAARIEEEALVIPALSPFSGFALILRKK
jgi:alpha-galactosidase